MFTWYIAGVIGCAISVYLDCVRNDRGIELMDIIMGILFSFLGPIQFYFVYKYIKG